MTDAWLMDTNILLRWAFIDHHDYSLVSGTVGDLRQRGCRLYATPQNLIEFWNSATRPADGNGFGLTPTQADEALHRIEWFFDILEDTPEVYRAWRRLVVEYEVSGVQVHDARLVAMMRMNGVPNILTFNDRHFRRYHFITTMNPRDTG
jgi:predicted nucleic acid-binding protein